MVTTFVLLGCVALVLLVIGTWLMIRGAAMLPSDSPPPTVAAPPPPPAPTPFTQKAAVERPQYVRIRWVTKRGDILGETVIDKRLRRGQLRRAPKKGREQMFAASHEEGGVWVYRYLHDV
jgi:hypothetical protein